MKKYRVVKYNGGGWTTIEVFESLEDAQNCYQKSKNDKDLIGLSVEPYRKMAYMLERSDWD